MVLRAPVMEYDLEVGGEVEKTGYFEADAMMRFVARGTPAKRMD